MTVRVIVFFFYYANEGQETHLRADIAELCGRVRISV